MSACPINLFNPILLYLLPKLKRYSGRKPPRPVYAKALYLQQQIRLCFIVGEIALCMAFVVSSAYSTCKTTKKPQRNLSKIKQGLCYLSLQV